MTTVRRIRSGDEASLARIAAGVFDGPILPDRLASYLAVPQHLFVVAVDQEGLVVGQARAIHRLFPDAASELYIDNVGVGDDWRRRGVARAMLDELARWGRELGCREAWVLTDPENESGLATYASLGFAGTTVRLFARAL